MIEIDALVIGAGPVGLFQVFQLGLLEINAHVVDSLPYPGGQCIELYPDKPIYDIPGTVRCTGRELTASLLQQIAPMHATLHLAQVVSQLAKRPDGRFEVATSAGLQFLAKTVVLAGGVGSFQPRLLRLPGLEAFDNHQVFYQVTDPARFAGQDLVIVGGEEAAVHWAIALAADGPTRPKSVTLLHRRETLKAPADALARLKALCDSQQITFTIGQVTGFGAAEGRLQKIVVTDVNGESKPQTLDALLVLFGLSPKLGPIADWGLAMERKQVTVDTAKFQTSVPGLFAVGDVNTYPGKKKLILSGFHECALAAFGAAEIVFPDRPTLLEYTTTSSRLHKLLGAAGTEAPAV